MGRTAEQRAAAEKRRAPKWTTYDYRKETLEGEHNHAELENRMDYTHV